MTLVERLRYLGFSANEAGQETADLAHEAADEIERLRAVADAARKMPRWTPRGGAASTKHTYQIEACDTWALDAALKELDRTPALTQPTPSSATE